MANFYEGMVKGKQRANPGYVPDYGVPVILSDKYTQKFELGASQGAVNHAAAMALFNETRIQGQGYKMYPLFALESVRATDMLKRSGVPIRLQDTLVSTNVVRNVTDAEASLFAPGLFYLAQVGTEDASSMSKDDLNLESRDLVDRFEREVEALTIGPKLANREQLLAMSQNIQTWINNYEETPPPPPPSSNSDKSDDEGEEAEGQSSGGGDGDPADQPEQEQGQGGEDAEAAEMNRPATPSKSMAKLIDRKKFDGEFEFVRGELKYGQMSWDTVPLVRSMANSRAYYEKQMRVDSGDTGSQIRRPDRWFIDQKIFRNKKRRKDKGAWVVLVDTSGSMGLTQEDVAEVLMHAPVNSTIAIYAGSRDTGCTGKIRIVAQGGRMAAAEHVGEIDDRHWLNIIDVPALKWLAKQDNETKVYVGDGGFTGSNHSFAREVRTKCKNIIRENKIIWKRRVSKFVDYARERGSD